MIQKVKLNDLWRILLSPLLWAAHFLASYVTVALWCAKLAGRSEQTGSISILVALYTVVALAGIAIVGWQGHRQANITDTTTSSSAPSSDTPYINSLLYRRRFFGFTTLILSGLSGVADLYTFLVPLVVRSCH